MFVDILCDNLVHILLLISRGQEGNLDRIFG